MNTKGPWYLASRAAPRMAQHGGGSIINVISVGGLKPPAYQGFYAGSKAALHALTKVMAAEWAHMGIRVNALAPGSYHSDLFEVRPRSCPVSRRARRRPACRSASRRPTRSSAR